MKDVSDVSLYLFLNSIISTIREEERGERWRGCAGGEGRAVERLCRRRGGESGGEAEIGRAHV